MLLIDSRAARVDRLQKAIYAWGVDVAYRLAVPWRGCALLTLTFAGGDREAARGAIRSFIDKIKDRYKIRFFFWWAELQRRGMIHYHILIPNSPWIDEVWLRGAWNFGFSSVRWLDGSRGIGYALKYARKMKKRYQQDYALFSKLFRNFRAYSSNRLRDWFARSWKFPGWLREKIWELGECPVRVDSGWLFKATGEVVRSPWGLVGLERLEGGGWVLAFERAPEC